MFFHTHFHLRKIAIIFFISICFSVHAQRNDQSTFTLQKPGNGRLACFDTNLGIALYDRCWISENLWQMIKNGRNCASTDQRCLQNFHTQFTGQIISSKQQSLQTGLSNSNDQCVDSLLENFSKILTEPATKKREESLRLLTTTLSETQHQWYCDSHNKLSTRTDIPIEAYIAGAPQPFLKPTKKPMIAKDRVNGYVARLANGTLSWDYSKSYRVQVFTPSRG